MRKLGERLRRRHQQANSPSSKKRQGSELAQPVEVVALRRPLSHPQSAPLPLTNAQDIGEFSIPDLSIHAQVSNKLTRTLTKALDREKETERKNTIIGQERVLSRLKGETECAKLRDYVRHSSLLSKEREQTMKEAAATALADFRAVEGTTPRQTLRHQNTTNLAHILQLEMNWVSNQKDAPLREALPFSTPRSANKNIQVKAGRRHVGMKIEARKRGDDVVGTVGTSGTLLSTPSEPTILKLIVNEDHLKEAKADGVSHVSHGVSHVRGNKAFALLSAIRSRPRG
jgi:hypothetical protein